MTAHIYIEDVKKDFDLFYPWVKPGGLVVFHNVSPKFPGVLKVWKENTKPRLSSSGNCYTLHFEYKPGFFLSSIIDKIKMARQNKNGKSAFKNKMSRKVFLVIPVHNRIKFTKKCLASCSVQTYKNFEVILVDGESKDGTANFFQKNYPTWTLIKGTKKWWWTRSVHEGVKYALKKAGSNDFVLTMNNDCFFKRNYLSEIVKSAVENKNSIIGSLILDANNPNRVVNAGVKIVWEKALIYSVAKHISSNIKYYTARGTIKNLVTLPGKGTLIPIKVIKKIGNFNHRRLPHYLADYEFFCRAKRGNYKLVVSSHAKLYNFAKETGSAHLQKHSASYKEVSNVLFGRKSKLNVFDHLNFLILCCPRKYLLKNLRQVSTKLLGYLLKLLPFYYIKIFVFFFNKTKYNFRLLMHNLPIYLRQNKILYKIRLLLHNIPIYFKQNKTLRKLKI